MTIWKAVPSSNLEVSIYGEVRRIIGDEYKPAPEFSNQLGYRFIGFKSGGQSKIVSVHKLVMEAFVGVRPKGYCVNHKNKIPWDNRLKNLEYVTPQYNQRHGLGITNRKFYTVPIVDACKETGLKRQNLIFLVNHGFPHKVHEARGKEIFTFRPSDVAALAAAFRGRLEPRKPFRRTFWEWQMRINPNLEKALSTR